MKAENRAAKGGVVILTIIQIIFIVLKMCKLIDWTWGVVLIPLWIHLGTAFIFLATLILIAIVDNK